MTSPGDVPRSDAWTSDLGVAAAVGDGVVVLAPGGTIVWANRAMGDLMGADSQSLLGRNGLDLIQADELERAADGLAYTSQFPGRTAVAPYRAARADGTLIDLELKATLLPHPDGDHVVLVVRDGTSRSAVNRALRSVASGASVEETAVLTCEAVALRWPNTGVAVSYGTSDGREVIGQGLSEVLLDHARGACSEPGCLAPWESTTAGAVAMAARADLTPGLAAAAEAEGFEGCAIAVLDDPGGEPCCLVVWFDHLAIARLEFRHAADELAELLSLALERRHHSWHLRHLARHDGLTGVLNRVGFFELFDQQLEACRLHGDEVMAVLYVDVDDLKVVNDRQGHAAGDRLLAHVGRLLGRISDPEALVGRVGGDEFVVARRFTRDHARAGAQALAEQVAHSLVDTRDGAPDVGASIGVALDEPGTEAAHAIERADAAMYRAKAQGWPHWSF